MPKITNIKYGNTNTYLIHGTNGSLLIDTDYAGTLSSFFRTIKSLGIKVSDITYIIATHYHPDHIGLVGELVDMGIKLAIIDTQYKYVHFSDKIFERDNIYNYKSIKENEALLIKCEESRGFLRSIGIEGEIISTVSHSEDSISLILDSGECFVGDLEPIEYLSTYENNEKLKADWEKINKFKIENINYSHIGTRK